MGQITAINGVASKISVAHRQRFARHFPGLFAYVRAMSNGYATGIDKVVSAFEIALSETHADEDAFVLSLFTNARKLCGVDSSAHDASEREVLSLTFDAQLTREQVSVLLEMPVGAVVSILLRGLRRLKTLRLATEAAGDAALHGFAA
jgi:DNA-directed RNA polymerase specialized sigma24 family protein